MSSILMTQSLVLSSPLICTLYLGFLYGVGLSSQPFLSEMCFNMLCKLISSDIIDWNARLRWSSLRRFVVIVV